MSNSPSQPVFEVRPEISALYDVSFILCGLFYCRQCGAAPPEESEAPAYSDLHYYKLAEVAYEQGWRPDPLADCDALCPTCTAQQAAAAEST